MKEADATRARILGVLIQDARKYAGRSVEECAHVLNVSPEEFEQAEQGQYLLSLPDLEALALYLKVPMGHFWGSETLSSKTTLDYQNFISLRHRVIGVLLRQLRLQARRSQEDLAQMLDVDVDRLQAYETGETPIPYLHLEQLSRAFEVSITHFVENQRGPLSRHEAEQKLQRLFHQLSPEMQAFISTPTNISYLETARRLSEMDVQKLRQVAENLLDITY